MWINSNEFFANLKILSHNLFFLTVGRNPKTDPAAAKITEELNHAFQLALQKRAAAQKGKGNLGGTLKNVVGLASFVTQFLKNTAGQAVPLLQNTVKGTVNGLGQGLKRGGLIPGLTGALSQGTTGLAKGIANGFGKIDQDNMKLWSLIIFGWLLLHVRKKTNKKKLWDKYLWSVL